MTNKVQREKLNSLIDDARKLAKSGVTSSAPEFKAWHVSVQRWLNQAFGKDSYEAKEFAKTSFSLSMATNFTPASEWILACQRGLLQSAAVLQTYLDDEVEDQANDNLQRDARSIFLVHGHDGELREALARLLDKQGLNPVILMEQANAGKTIIEKFEEYSNVGAAICLFTGDDLPGEKDSELKRARQNVVFEAGYFIGRLGRDRVIVLADQNVDMPSDLSGVLHIDTHNWQLDVLKELHAMGYKVDLNKLV